MDPPLRMAVAGCDRGLLELVGQKAVRPARVIVACFALSCGGSGNAPHPVPGDRGPAITVEVLNASGRPGEARVATRLLRDAGIDVVYFGNAPDGGLDSTRILVRRGPAQVGERVRVTLGQGRVA